MNVLVVGAGWFGCEIAQILDERDDVHFDMIDRTDSFFSGSSSANQNRLHIGYHYCRSFETREECRKGYDIFMEKYPMFTEEVKSYYMVANKSVLDFKTYISIFENENTPFEIKTLEDLKRDGIEIEKSFVNGENVITVGERWINFEKARDYFTTKFSSKMLQFEPSKLSISHDCNQISYGQKQYDLVFDATYGKLIHPENSEYEVCITLIYRKVSEPSETSQPPVTLTVVDGNFYSLYAYKPTENLFTLTSVHFTPIFVTKCAKQVDEFIKNITPLDINRHRALIEHDVSKSFINLLTDYMYHSYFLSIKTKFINTGFSDRHTRVEKNGKIVSVCGGKITGALQLQSVVEKALLNNKNLK